MWQRCAIDFTAHRTFISRNLLPLYSTIRGHTCCNQMRKKCAHCCATSWFTLSGVLRSFSNWFSTKSPKHSIVHLLSTTHTQICITFDILITFWQPFWTVLWFPCSSRSWALKGRDICRYVPILNNNKPSSHKFPRLTHPASLYRVTNIHKDLIRLQFGSLCLGSSAVSPWELLKSESTQLMLASDARRWDTLCVALSQGEFRKYSALCV